MHMQSRNVLTDIENKLVVTKGEKEVRRDKLEVWDSGIQTTMYKTDTRQRYTV